MKTWGIFAKLTEMLEKKEFFGKIFRVLQLSEGIPFDSYEDEVTICF
jgi:hypothetical protein